MNEIRQKAAKDKGGQVIATQAEDIDISQNYEVDSHDNERREYEYADEEEFWEPASQEQELKIQLGNILQIPIIKEEHLQ